ncbi:MAG: MotE family protein [Roseiarcus sp.]|jgi:flagellar motility protein MotE (MotC chaperone)
MPSSRPVRLGLSIAILIAGLAAPTLAQDGRKPEPDGARKSETEANDGVQQYCSNIANVASDARIAWQTRRLGELETQVKQQIAELDAKTADAKAWVDRRSDLMSKAEDGVAAIYAKMDPEAAAAQLTIMEEPTAAALLGKLSPKVSSAILDEMEPGKAAKLTEILAANALTVERKKS